MRAAAPAPAADPGDAVAVVDFWCREIGPEGWFRTDPKLDAAIRERFHATWAEAHRGHLRPWLATPTGALALLVLLDQFPRNMFRGQAAAFGSDARAGATAKRAIALGHDQATPEPDRLLFYLPLMHAESLADQERCVRLVLMRLPETGAEALDAAVRHREVIRRFGRFPARNAALGRADTPDERAYRQGGGYMG